MEALCLASDHFTLLGLKPDAGGAEAKKAYYDLTRRYHPDRFFGKDLGSFKDRIYRVFKQITVAQQVLSDPERRGRYLSEHPELSLPAAGPRRPEDEARAAERRARILRHPYLSKQARVHELVTRGRAYLQQGEHTRAYNDLNLAAQMDPGHKEIGELLALAKKGGDKKRAEVEFQEAKKLESLPLADRDQIVKHLRNAIALDADNALYCHTLAKKLIAGGQAADLKEATLLARKSTEKAPDNADYHNTHGDLCMMSGLEKNARREYEAAQKLRPDDEHAKQQLKKLKWK
jgi:curved DNA-binding protein CbpA